MKGTFRRKLGLEYISTVRRGVGRWR